MKKISIIALTIFSFFLLGGCSDEEKNENHQVISDIKLSASTFKIGPEGGTCEVTITSTENWRIAGNCDWVTPSAEEGKNGDTVIFTVAPNDTEKDRETTFKLFAGSCTQTITITSGWAYVMELVSEPEIMLNATGGEVSIELNTNVPQKEISYNIENGDDWITFQNMKNLFGNTLLLFNITSNNTYKSREAKICITGYGKNAETIIHNEQQNVVLSDFTSKQYDLEARDIAVEIRTNVEYLLELPTWISSLNESEEETDEEGLTHKIHKFHISEASIGRTGQIKFNYKGETLKTIDIQQIDPNAEIVEIPDEVFRNYMISKQWVVQQEGTKCIVLDAAKSAEELYIWGSEYTGLKNLKGIEALENIEKVTIGFVPTLEEFDISGLHKVTEIDISTINAIPLSLINIGDNRISYPNFSLSISVPKLKLLGGSGTELIQFVHSSKGTLQTIDISEAEGTMYDIYGVSTILISLEQQSAHIKINKDPDTTIEIKK